MSKKYFLHFRHDFSLLFLDILLNDTIYFKVDYIFIYNSKRGNLSAYLTKKGLIEAESLGEENILNNKDWKNIFKDGLKILGMVDDLCKIKIEYKESPGIFLSLLDEVAMLFKQFANVYFFCEEPVLAKIERQSKNDILEYVGKYKLKAHLEMEKIENLFREIITKMGKELGVDSSDLFFLTLDELKDFLDGSDSKEYKKIIDGRKDGYVYLKERGVWKISVGDFYKKMYKKLLPPEHVKKVKGVVACKCGNKIVGKVKIHLSWMEVTKLKKDEILVAGMTNPQLVPYLKNAIGIVTDEGGLTCHAAILSRELDIPCIVGTQEASQVFEDGDFIEMDMNNGIVNKI